MSIVSSFDNESKSIIDLDDIFKAPNHIADICIVTFSIQVKEMVLKQYNCKHVGFTKTANGNIDVYSFIVNGKTLLFYMSPIGSACAACVMHEIHYVTGASKFIVYGSCGILDVEKCKGNLIVPNSAYRDEGLSYHYMEVSDYVNIKNSDKIAEIFQKYEYPYVKGKTWTTDAIYMETKNKADARKNEGCICVEMESAGLQAMCNYYGYELYIFFFGADLLNGDAWDKATLGNEEEFDLQRKTFKIAVDVAVDL